MIRYRKGYKYQLAKDYAVSTPVYPSEVIEHEFYTLKIDGTLYVKSGYAWDGASGPTIDTKSSMRPSLVHDCFCQMMRDKSLDFKWQEKVNLLFKDMCIEDGMWGWRAHLWYLGVKAGDAGNPNQGPDGEILEAP